MRDREPILANIKVSQLYEDIRARKNDLSALVTSMQQITGDATPAWEDKVMSEAKNNITLNTLFRMYKRTRRRLQNLLDKTVPFYDYDINEPEDPDTSDTEENL